MKNVSRYLRPYKRPSRWLWLLAAMLIAASVSLGAAAYKRQLATERLQARIERLQGRQAALTAAKPSRQDLEQQRHWTALKLERDFPWEQVFQAVERADSKDIELLEFQPDKRGRTVILRGEAREQDALVAYLERLTLQTSLANVHLLHQKAAAHGQLRTVVFEIKATLVGQAGGN